MRPAASGHCEDNAGDRRVGQAAEEAFCRLMLEWGRSITAHQIRRTGAAVATVQVGNQTKNYVLPDVTLWDDGSQHHEIKHKYATPGGKYGLEKYRFEDLIWFAERTGRPVYYTIHDWKNAGATKSSDPIANNITDWITCNVERLAEQLDELWEGPSYVNGVKARVPIYYWPSALWMPLWKLWFGKR
jgi:hypothetical protein